MSKGFYYACDDIKATHRFVIYPGDDNFPLPEGIEVMGLLGFLEVLQAEMSGAGAMEKSVEKRHSSEITTEK